MDLVSIILSVFLESCIEHKKKADHTNVHENVYLNEQEEKVSSNSFEIEPIILCVKLQGSEGTIPVLKHGSLCSQRVL